MNFWMSIMNLFMYFCNTLLFEIFNFFPDLCNQQARDNRKFRTLFRIQTFSNAATRNQYVLVGVSLELKVFTSVSSTNFSIFFIYKCTQLKKRRVQAKPVFKSNFWCSVIWTLFNTPNFLYESFKKIVCRCQIETFPSPWTPTSMWCGKTSGFSPTWTIPLQMR